MRTLGSILIWSCIVILVAASEDLESNLGWILVSGLGMWFGYILLDCGLRGTPEYDEEV